VRGEAASARVDAQASIICIIAMRSAVAESEARPGLADCIRWRE
jgi:hypothetical protein